MKISVITVCFNSEKTIEKTILSIINQNFKNIEYIVVDGGSTDNTIKIINKYSKFVSKLISEKDRGIYEAINKGIKSASGDVISILHSDDFYFDNSILNKVVDFFSKNLNLKCLIGTTIMKSKFNDNIVRKYSPINFKIWKMYLGISPPHPSMFLKKDIYKKFGLYNENYKIAGDFEFYLRILFKNKVLFHKTDETFTVMQYGGVSTNSIKSNLISSKEILKSFKENNIYNNWLIILLRFPIKILQFIFKK
jgi:glycosyltransferase involved in cell wall biosynthesis